MRRKFKQQSQPRIGRPSVMGEAPHVYEPRDRPGPGASSIPAGPRKSPRIRTMLNIICLQPAYITRAAPASWQIRWRFMRAAPGFFAFFGDFFRGRGGGFCVAWRRRDAWKTNARARATPSRSADSAYTPSGLFAEAAVCSAKCAVDGFKSAAVIRLWGVNCGSKIERGLRTECINAE